MNRMVFLLTLAIIMASPPFFARAEESLPVSGVSAEVIAAYPTPAVRRLAPNEALLYDRQYERISQAVTIFDAPNGNVRRTLDQGFNFVTVMNKQDGWTQINPDQWVQDAYLTPAQPSRFAGVLLPDEGLPYDAAWILVNVVPSRAPGQEPTRGDLAVLRYTLVNLYSETEIDGWTWYQIGVDQWVDQRQIARILPVERAPEIDTEKWVSVDLYEQVAIAYEGERPVFATLISSGLSQWATNEGLFHVYVRYPRTVMSGAAGRPDFYYLEEVPWTLYFDNDIGLHGTYWHDGFGYRRSHGCVNMSITDSAWLYQWSSSEFDLTIPGDTGPAVYVYSSGVYR